MTNIVLLYWEKMFMSCFCHVLAMSFVFKLLFHYLKFSLNILTFSDYYLTNLSKRKKVLIVLKITNFLYKKMLKEYIHNIFLCVHNLVKGDQISFSICAYEVQTKYLKILCILCILYSPIDIQREVL